MKDARTALNDALKTAIKDHPHLKDEDRILTVFNVVVIAMSGEDRAIKSWDDVRGCTHEAVEAHLDEGMKSIQDSVTAILMDVIDRAEKATPTYVSPPPFK